MREPIKPFPTTISTRQAHEMLAYVETEIQRIFTLPHEQAMRQSLDLRKLQKHIQDNFVLPLTYRAMNWPDIK